MHASGERGFVAANAWLVSPAVRAHVQSIASLDAAYGLHVLERQVFVVAAAVQLDLLVPALVALAVSLEALTEPETPREGTLPASLAPLMRFEEFAVSDDLDRSELFETRADDVQRVAREVEPFVGEIAEYLEGRVWTREMHCLSDLLELVREARLCRPVEE